MSSSRTRRVLGSALRSLRPGGRVPLCLTWHLEAASDPITTDRALDVIDALAELGGTSVHLRGQTLLSRSDLRTLIQRLRFHAIDLRTSVPPDEVARRVKHLSGCQMVTVSVSDHPVAQVRSALRALADRGWSRGVELTIGPDTSLDDLEHYLSLCSDLGARLAISPAPIPTPTLSQLAAMRALIDRVISAAEAGNQALPLPAVLTHLKTWPSVAKLPCSVQRWAVILDEQGGLHPCHESIESDEGVSVLRSGLAGALDRLVSRACFECWAADRALMRAARRRGPLAVQAAHRKG